MARRIKEEPVVHQNRIAEKAMVLFAKKGIENTKMDEIAAGQGMEKQPCMCILKTRKILFHFYR